MKQRPLAAPPDAEEITRHVRADECTQTLAEVAAQYGVSPNTLARLLGGLPLRAGTWALLRQALRERGLM